MKRKLTTQEISFANFIVDGLTQTEAYRRAYNNRLEGTALRVEAHKKANSPRIAEYIAGLRAKLEDSRLLTRQKKRQILFKIATDPKAKKGERIEAIKTDNAMTGDNKPVRVEGEITLFSVLKDIKPTLGLPSDDDSGQS